MASTLKHLRSSTADKRPTASGLVDGQLAINTASGTPALFFKDNNGGVVKVGPVHVGSTAPNAVPAGSAGNSLGELWVDNSLTTPGLNYYTGSAFVNLTPSGTTTTVGLVELATPAETQTGTDAVRAVTPSGLQSKVSDSTSTTSSTTIASSTAVKSAYDLANAALPKAGGTVTGELLIGNTGSLVFEGSSDDSFETTIAVVDPTGDRTITFPNVTGTVVTTGDSGTVTSTMIANDTIVNADINSAAAIAYSKLALSSGIVNTDISASAAIVDTKLATISTADKVSISALDIDGATDIGGALEGGDLFVVDDGAGGTNRKTPAFRVSQLVYSGVTGDIAIASGGTASISAGVIVNADINSSAAIDFSKLASLTSANILLGNASNVATSTAVTGDVTISNTGVTAIASGAIVDADISASAEIAVSKLADGVARQLLQTDAAGTGVEWASNIDIPGTLDVTSAATFDSTIGASAGTASLPSITFTGDLNTGIYSPGADQVAISTNGSIRALFDANGNFAIGNNAQNDVGYGGFTVNGANGSIITLRSGGANSGRIYTTGTDNINIDGNGSASTNILFRTGTSSTERLRITSAGLVGIGTSSVTHALTVTTSGTDAVKINTADYGYLDLSNGTSTVRLQNVANVPRIGTATNHPLVFAVNESEKMRLTSTGLGIGTTSPGETLDVVGTGARVIKSGDASNPRIIFTPVSGDAQQITPYGDGDATECQLAFHAGTAGTERARIDSSGRLLVGTSSSSAEAKFIVQGGTTASGGAVNIQRNATTASAGSTIGFISFTNSANNVGATISADGDGTWNAGTSHPTLLKFSTTKDGQSSPTESCRIDSSQRLLIGKTGTGFSTNGVEIGSPTIDGNWNLWLGTTSGTDQQGNIAANQKTSGAWIMKVHYNGTEVGGVRLNGTTGVQYPTSSDYRLKENIAPIENALSRVQALNPVRFNFIAAPDITVDGFIAHEAQEVVPEAVCGEKDAVNDEGIIIPQGIDQAKLVPLLTAALQEAIGEIESLKARLTAAGI